MSTPEDERERFWKALQANSDRITELEVVVSTRQEMMRDTITSAVQAAMPKSLLNEDEHEFVKMQFQRWKDSAAFRKKVIESAAIWAIPIVLVSLLAVFKDYVIAHGMWKP